MRIAINSLSENPLKPSGAFGYYQNLFNNLNNIINDDELYIFVSNKSEKYFGPYDNPKIKKIIFTHSNENKWLRILTEHFIFPFVIKRHGIDVLINGTSILYCPCRLIAILKTMHVYTNPAAISFTTRIYRKMAYWLTCYTADAIISNSKSHSRDIVKYLGINKNKIIIINEALNHDLFKPILKSESNSEFLKSLGIYKSYILFVSSLYPYKNTETLIKAYSELKSRDKYQLVIAGYLIDIKYSKKLVQLTKDLDILSDIIFTGGINHSDTARLYQSASIFVYPSKYETFGLTILEAMASGCPVITSNISSMPEIGGNAALYFNPEDPEELTEKMNVLFSDNKLRKNLIKLGLKRSSEFTWAKTAQNTLKVIHNLMN